MTTTAHPRTTLTLFQLRLAIAANSAELEGFPGLAETFITLLMDDLMGGIFAK